MLLCTTHVSAWCVAHSVRLCWLHDLVCLQVLLPSAARAGTMRAGAVATATSRCRSHTSWLPACSTGRRFLAARASSQTYVSSSARDALQHCRLWVGHLKLSGAQRHG